MILYVILQKNDAIIYFNICFCIYDNAVSRKKLIPMYEYDPLTTCLFSLRERVDAFDVIQTHMDYIAATLTQAIEGNAVNAFIEGHNSVKKQYDEIQIKTKYFLNNLEAAVDMIHSEDAAVAAKFLKIFCEPDESNSIT